LDVQVATEVYPREIPLINSNGADLDHINGATTNDLTKPESWPPNKQTALDSNANQTRQAGRLLRSPKAPAIQHSIAEIGQHSIYMKIGQAGAPRTR